MIKSVANLLVIALVAIGLITAVLQFTIWLNKAFMYPLGLGISILVVLAAFELFERGK